MEGGMNAVSGSTRRPVILLSIRDESARTTVARELERRYAPDYLIVATDGNAAASEALGTAARKGEQVALLLSDEPSPLAAGETIFAQARRLFPDVRRGLLIEWGSWADHATADAVLALMATGQIDYYVIRPWHSPDEYFHRTVTEFLLEWERAIGERPREVTVIGDAAQPRTHDLRNLLARGGVPHAYAFPDSPEGMRVLLESGVTYAGVPLVRLLDGRILSDPTNAELAAAYGLSTELPKDEVDVAIVGAGPAGLSAAVYAASEGLRTLVIERESIGGQAGSSALIRNYLGFSRGISGSELAQRAYQQAWVFGATFAHSREVLAIRPDGDWFVLTVSPGEEVRARSVVLATGVTYRRLDVPELAAFEGSSVFYGASAVEAKVQTGRIVHVVGGGNSAGQAALHLARYAKSVTLLVRGGRVAESMSQYLIDQLKAAGVRIEVLVDVAGGGGGGHGLDHLVLRNRATGVEREEPSDALFVLIGAAPHTRWLPASVLRDRWGYILTGTDVTEGGRAWPHDRMPEALETSVPGIFAVGDTRRGSVKRVASAVGEGSVVVSSVHAFLARARAADAART